MSRSSHTQSRTTRIKSFVSTSNARLARTGAASHSTSIQNEKWDGRSGSGYLATPTSRGAQSLAASSWSQPSGTLIGLEHDLKDVPPLEKIPTNQFVLDKFLDEDDENDDFDHGDDHVEENNDGLLSALSSSRLSRKSGTKDDDTETVLDVSESYLPYDETGQRAYQNACRKYGATPAKILLRKLANATELDLNHYGIGPKGAQALAIPLCINQRITKLSLRGNNLNKAGIDSIMKMLMGNSSITHLDISYNNLQIFGAKCLAAVLSENTYIQSLDVSNNGFGDVGAQILCKALEEHSGIKTLSLSNNGFGSGSASHLKTMISENGILDDLDLSWNQLRTRGAVEVAHGVRDNIGMKKLNLAWNGFGKEGTKAIAEALGSCTLRELDLSSNRVDDEGFISIVKALRNNDDLKILKNYCDEQGIGLVELFARFDDDGSMSVTHDEFKQGLKEAKIPLSELQIQELIKTLDEDGDGEIDFSELILGAQRIEEG